MKKIVNGELIDMTPEEIAAITAMQNVVVEPTTDAINAERDRRIAANFVFDGVAYDFDMRAKADITGAGALAGIAIIAGAQPGDLMWTGEDEEEFGWIAADNTRVPMDAHTCFAFSKAAARHYKRHIDAGRTLKDLEEIPLDFADDSYWT